MSRTVYFSTRQQHGGCGCLALGLILGLLFLKSFWRPLLLFFLLVTVVGWIRAFFVPKKTTTFQREQPYFEDTANPYGPSYQSRKRKAAEVIEED